jgi:hypothetical protein
VTSAPTVAPQPATKPADAPKKDDDTDIDMGN